MDFKKIMGKAKDGFNKAINAETSNGVSIKSVCQDGVKAVKDTVNKVSKKDENDTYVTNKKEMVFPTLDSMQSVVNVINEANCALKDKSRTIKESSIPETLAGVGGAAVGGAISFAALYGLGTVGLSAAGITSGLATAGALVGGGMVAGVFVLAAPVAILAGTSVAVAAHLKNKQLRQEKERLYQEALKKHDAIIKELKKESDESKDRIEYLNSLNILLTSALKDLEKDLGVKNV